MWGVVAGGAARCSTLEAEMYGYNTLGIAQVSAVGSSEASAPQSRSRGGVLSREAPFLEVPLYARTHTHTHTHTSMNTTTMIGLIDRLIQVYNTDQLIDSSVH